MHHPFYHSNKSQMLRNCGSELNEEKIDVSKFSSPMPTIGVYITTATVACLIFMVFDIISGISHKRRWIPCKLFSLNSLTLTLIGIATKLPSDLTTPMLSEIAQFSKFSGIFFMNTCMNFFLPSLGTATPSQNLSNLISVSILFITVSVNSCIQFFTGALLNVYSLLPLVLFLLLSPLIDLWISALEINNEKIIISDHNRENLINGSGSMIHRLRCCYVRSFATNPQLILCMNQYGICIIVIYILSLLISGAFPMIFFYRYSLYCRETSDYKFSIQLVLVTQHITILVGNIVILSRCFMFRGQIGLQTRVNFLLATVESLQVMLIINHKTPYHHLLCAATWIWIKILSIRLRITLFFLQVKAAFIKYLCIGNCRNSVPKSIDEQQKNVKKWIEKKGEEEIDRLIDSYRKDSPNHLIQFLCDNHPSDELFHEYGVSCLSAALLVRMASDTFPSHPLIQSLIHTFHEAFPIILFIDENTSPASFVNKRKFKFAEKMWKLWDFKSSLKISHIGKATGYIQSSTGLRTTQRESYFNAIQKEISLIENIIHRLRFTSKNDPCIGIKQVLADMLHEFLSKFPIAVFKYVTEAPSAESEDRIKLAIKFLCKLESLEDKIR